jgi:GGDEF domain-containing protein
MSRTATPDSRLHAGGWEVAPRLVESRPAHRTAATHDLLTGLARRSTLVAHVAHALAASEGTSARVGVVACRITGLDVVEGRRGPMVRDEVLVEVAARMRRVVGGDDAPALLAPDVLVAVAIRSSALEVEAAATAIARAVRAPIPTASGAVSVGAITDATLADRRSPPDETLARLVGAPAASSRGRRTAPAPLLHATAL